MAMTNQKTEYQIIKVDFNAELGIKQEENEITSITDMASKMKEGK